MGMAISEVTMPTRNAMRVPWTRRWSTSRPSPSVPRGCRAQVAITVRRSARVVVRRFGQRPDQTRAAGSSLSRSGFW